MPPSSGVHDRLDELKCRIEKDSAPHRCFFFASSGGIEGYWGTGPVAFVAERPSLPPPTRKQATHAFSDRFHDLLVRYGFASAHVTDLIKQFPGTGLGYEKLIELNWPYLVEELEIVDAKLVVAVGTKVQSIRAQRLGKEIMHVPHYSYRYGVRAILQARLDEGFARVRMAADALTD